MTFLTKLKADHPILVPKKFYLKSQFKNELKADQCPNLSSKEESNMFRYAVYILKQFLCKIFFSILIIKISLLHI